MRRMCECGRRVYLKIETRAGFAGIDRPTDHDLCRRCYRAERNRSKAQRLSSKPYWRMHATLRLLEQQPTHKTLESSCA